MEIRVKIEKKHAFLIAIAFALFALSIFVYAYIDGNTGTPNVMGHSVGEIDWSKSIISDLRINGTNALELGTGVSGKESNAGKIVYGVFSQALNIVGAGIPGQERVVKIWEKLVVQNDVCIEGGNCLSQINDGTHVGKDEYVICPLGTGYDSWNCRYRVDLYNAGYNCLSGYYLVEMHQSWNGAELFIDAVRCRQF